VTKYWLALVGTVVLLPTVITAQERPPYPVVSTGQGLCYDHCRENNCPQVGPRFYGQDAQKLARSMRYALSSDRLLVIDPSRRPEANRSPIAPFLNTKYFASAYGFPEEEKSSTDSQYASATLYVDHSSKLFGLDFADGRIKA
jgi:hypothetical protein